MRALIVYDDFAAAARANATLQRIGCRGDVSVHWIIKPWQVNVLREAIPAETALADAAEAHLILFAGRRAQSIPFWIRDWLERWTALRQIQDAALAVIDDGYGAGIANPANSELSHLAQRYGLNLITDEGTVAKAAASLFGRFSQEHELPLALEQSRFADSAMCDSVRGLGFKG
jgi:hypothetical protein